MSPALWLLTALVCSLLCGGAALAEEPMAPASAGETASAAALIDLNRAGLAELTSLPGIGQKRAEAILAFREAHGGFQSVSQLLRIKGIGRAMLRKLRLLVTISSLGANAPDARVAENGPRASGSGGAHRVR